MFKVDDIIRLKNTGDTSRRIKITKVRGENYYDCIPVAGYASYIKGWKNQHLVPVLWQIIVPAKKKVFK